MIHQINCLKHPKSMIKGVCLDNECQQNTKLFCPECLQENYHKLCSKCSQFNLKELQDQLLKPELIQKDIHNESIKQTWQSFKNAILNKIQVWESIIDSVCDQLSLRDVNSKILRIRQELNQQKVTKNYMWLNELVKEIKPILDNNKTHQLQIQQHRKVSQEIIIYLSKFNAMIPSLFPNFEYQMKKCIYQSELQNIKNLVHFDQESRIMTTIKQQQIVPLIVSCPLQCECQGKYSNIWNHKSCNTQLQLTSEGTVICNKCNIESSIGNISYQCGKNCKFIKFEFADQFIQSLSKGIEMGDQDLSKEESREFISSLNNSIRKRWNR